MGELYLSKFLFYELRHRCMLLKLYIRVYDIVNYTVVVCYLSYIFVSMIS